MRSTMAFPQNLRESNQFSVTLQFQKDNYMGETHFLDDFTMRYAFYAAFIAILLMIIALIVKLMWSSEGNEGSQRHPTENTALLLPSKGQEFVVTIYGTNEDTESSSQDFYDAKICVICYDDPRNCFFIPCGHCVSCHKCAHRIVKEESKSCPICRGTIYKVRKLSIL